MSTELTTAHWVEIYRGTDHLMVQMLAGALEAQGFTVRMHGSLSGAAIGAGEGVTSVTLLAMADQAEECAATLREMLEEAGGEAGLLSLFEEDAGAGELSFEDEAGEGALSDVTAESSDDALELPVVDPHDDNTGITAGDDDPSTSMLELEGLSPRKGYVAGGLSLLSAGFGHMYAGERWYGTLAFLGATAAMWSASSGRTTGYDWLVITGFTFFDSLLAAGRANRGKTRSPLAQLALGAALVAGGYLFVNVL